jgi:hypothetical protein
MPHAPAWNLSPGSFRPAGLSLSIALALSAAGSCAPPQAANRAVVRDVAVDSGMTNRRDAGPPDRQPTAEPDAAPDVGPPPTPPPSDAAPPPRPADGRASAGDTRALPIEQIEVSRASPALAGTDLGLEGTLDWAHFGFQSSTTVNRKRSASAPLILMSSLGASFAGRSSQEEFAQFLWSDGMPTPRGRNVFSGFETALGVSGGFQVMVQGDPDRSRTVRLYVGASGSGARLTARFGSFGPAVHVDRSLTAETLERNRVYTVVFRPTTAERTLVLEWIIESPDGRAGNVRLQAVTLAETDPVD